MKKTIPYLFVSIASVFIGYFIGNSMGRKKELTIQKNKTYAKLLHEVYAMELKHKSEHLSVKTVSELLDSDGYYSSDYNEKIVKGYIKNDASVLIGKDIRLKIDFLTKTKKVINSVTLEINDYVFPRDSLLFRERITVPQKTVSCNVNIVEFGSEEHFPEEPSPKP